MKESISMKMKKSIFLVIPFSILFACGQSVYTEKDPVTKTTLSKLEMYLTRNKTHEPYYRQNLTFVKETGKNDSVSYQLYDIITLPDKSFELDSKKMYIIIGSNFHPLENEYEKRYNGQQINQKKEEVMQSDSTKISVVSGYNVVNEKVYQMIHPIPAGMMEQIAGAEEVILRYTVGPDFINSEIRGRDLANLKKLIAK